MIPICGNPPYHIFANLDASGVAHGVFGRSGGVSQSHLASLNVGHTVGDVPEHVETNHDLIYGALGAERGGVITGRQVHGSRVARVTRADGGRVLDATDGLITDQPGSYLLLRFADCVPVLLLDPERRAIGLVHAGWRGTLHKIAAQGVQAMVEAYGCQPEEISAAIGPSIGPCCFEVGPEVIGAAREAFASSPAEALEALVSRQQPGGKAHLDLWQANALQLRELGVRNIDIAHVCTMCHPQEYYSHRASGGRTGRFAVMIGLRAE